MRATTTILRTETSSEAETVALAESFAREHQPPGFITLTGELGAGKTRFVRGIVRALGGEEGLVSSPTFAIVNEYDTPAGIVAHVDAYRLAGADELETIGWDELCERARVVLVEWPSRIAGAIDGTRYDVRIDHLGVSSRRVTITRAEL
ncbi:MAG: tRNA (adenosine(37)-N6)-threonylcarbamoyltransferase complex ATPase subunit type 1 TsaE [Phycisphaerales bacterium]